MATCDLAALNLEMTMGRVVTIRRADIEKIAQEFDSAPEDEPEEVNRRAAIRMLRPKIKVMRRKGYSLRHIADLLTKGGIPINAAMLASYMRAPGAKRSTHERVAERARTVAETVVALPHKSCP